MFYGPPVGPSVAPSRLRAAGLDRIAAMSLSQTSLLLIQAAEEHHEQVINPWIVGAVALGILLAMMVALVAFGGGREHS